MPILCISPLRTQTSSWINIHFSLAISAVQYNVFAYKIKLLAMAILDLLRRGATSLSLVLAINVLNG